MRAVYNVVQLKTVSQRCSTVTDVGNRVSFEIYGRFCGVVARNGT